MSEQRDRDEALCANALDKRGQRVDLLARELRAARYADALHGASRRNGVAKDAKLRRSGDVVDIEQLHAVAQVRLIRAETPHRFFVCETGERRDERKIGAYLPREAGEQFLEQFKDVFLGREAHLNIELGEIRLTVGAQVFVTRAASDLEVALHAGHHQELLVLLRRLGQRIERTRLHPGRYQVVASALGGAVCEHRCLDLGEVSLSEEAADMGGRLIANAEVALHALATQV